MKHCAVIGNPIKQSKSPIIHQNFAEQFSIELEYNKILSTTEKFKQDVVAFFNNGGVGMNVTAPFKQQAFELADRLTEKAQLAGAVNTLYIEENKLVGDTTDGKGLVRDLIFNNIKLENKVVLLIGAGGAARGCVKDLLEQNPSHLYISNRTVSKAQAIVEAIKDERCSAISFDDIPSDCDIVINSTSCSLTNEVPNIEVSKLKDISVAYDMSYKNETTSFNQWIASNTQAKTIDGLGMLVEQAAESFNIWHKKMPDTNELRSLLREE